MIFILFLFKTYNVGTRQNLSAKAVLTSTHDLCFRAKIRKMYTPVKTVLLYKSGVQGDIKHTDM